MNAEKLLMGAGILVLIIYFARRMFWLTKANRHNLITGEYEKADREVDKSHDWLSWGLMALGAALVLGSFFC